MAQAFHHALLRSVRLDLGMSQEEVAKALGIDVRTYRRYESGDVNRGSGFAVRSPSRRKLLRRMCEELGVESEDAWLTATESVSREAPGELIAAIAAMAPDEDADDFEAPNIALQRAMHFTGREDVLAALARWRDDKEARMLVVLGVGGAGKTAVVERFVAMGHDGASSRPWVHSFYEDPSTEAVVRELSARTRRDTHPREPRLVVLDGLETVQSAGGDGRTFGEIEAPSLRRALRAVAAGLVSRKVLVTTRMPLTDFVAWEGEGLLTHRLDPLSRDAARQLLRAWGIEGDNAALEGIVERTGGHALSIAMFGSYVATFLDGDPSRAASIPDPRDASDDDAVARKLASVLDSYARALAPNERAVLATLSLFGRPPDAALLASITRSSEEDVLRVLARLERVGLVARAGAPAGSSLDARVLAHPFVRDRFKRALGDDEARRAHARIGDVLGASLEGKPAGFIEDPDLLDRYEELFHHTLSSGRVVDAFALYTHALGGFGNLGLRVGAMARGARVLSRFARGGSPRTISDDLPPLARRAVLYEWGLFAGALGDVRLAAQCFDTHVALLKAALSAAPSENRPALAMSLRTRAYLAWLTGDLAASKAFLEQSIDFARAIEDESDTRFHLARAFALKAIVDHDGGDQAAALTALEAAHRFEATPTARRAFWEAEMRLARRAPDGTIADDDLGAARSLTTRAMDDCRRRGWRGHVAHGHTILGLLSLARNDITEARSHLALATPWVIASNEIEMTLRCHDLTRRVALACGDHAGAVSAARLGQNLAESHGVRLLLRRFT